MDWPKKGPVQIRVPALLMPRSAAVRYALTIAMAAWSVGMTYLLRSYITPVIFVFFYPAIIGAAWFGGFIPAALVGVVGVITADLLFIGPPGTLALPQLEELIAFGIFLLLASVVSLLMRQIRAAQSEVTQQAAELEQQALELEQAMEQAQQARHAAEEAQRRSEKERWRVSLLAETSRVLAEARDYHERLHGLAEVVVRELAEYCMVDVVDESGAVRRVSVAARDPERFARIERAREFPPQLDRDSGVGRVLRTGEPEIRLHVPLELLHQMAVSPDHLQMLLDVGPASYILMPMRTSDRLLGCISFIRSSASPHFDQDDVELARVLAIRASVLLELAQLYAQALQEIEQRRHAELALQRKAEELEELNIEQEETMAALQQQTEQAQEAERVALEASQAKSQFLAVMSHELRTPLNAIMGYTDLLHTGAGGLELTERATGFLERIRASVLHLRGLIDEILSLSRIEAGKEHIVPARVDLAGIVREVAAMMQADAVAKGLQLRVHVEGDVIGTTDPGKVRQILFNLTSNALKFTETGTVSITLRQEDQRVAIDVVDSGIGIAPADFERIFEPFTQVDQTRTRRAGGTGLGLAVSRHLARLLGGDLRVESAIGEGSRFMLTLPLEIPITAS